MAATHRALALRTDTRNCISISLLEFLNKGKLSGVTVSQVCKRAGVSRMAFYRNFVGLEDVLYEYFLGKISPVFKTIRESPDWGEKYQVQYELFEAIGAEMVASVERGYDHVIRRIFVMEIKRFYKSGRDAYWLEFVSAGVYAIWQKWLLDGRTTPLEDMMRFLKQMDSLSGVGT